VLCCDARLNGCLLPVGWRSHLCLAGRSLPDSCGLHQKSRCVNEIGLRTHASPISWSIWPAAETISSPQPTTNTMSASQPQPFGRRVYRRKQVREVTGLPNSTMYELLDPTSPRHDPTFPRPFPLGARSRGWLAEEVDQWIEIKAATRV
jgi:prophage regulatory protein